MAGWLSERSTTQQIHYLCLQSSWGHNFGFVCWHWNSWASGSIYGSQCHNVRQGWADLWSPFRTILSKGIHVEKINMLVENNFVLIRLIFFSLCLLQLWGSHVYIRMPLEIVFFLIETIIFWGLLEVMFWRMSYFWMKWFYNSMYLIVGQLIFGL